MSFVHAARAALLVLLLAGCTAATGDERSAWGSIDGNLSAIRFAGPKGWADFCARLPESCAAGNGVQQVALTRTRHAAMQQAQHEVASRIRPAVEPPGLDRWELDPPAGDCEDVAVSLREELVRHGWPSAALRLGLAITETGEPHVNLLVETDGGTIVLDNRFDRPARWTDLAELGYAWIGVEERDGSGAWRLSRAALAAAQGEKVVAAATRR